MEPVCQVLLRSVPALAKSLGYNAASQETYFLLAQAQRDFEYARAMHIRAASGYLNSQKVC